MICCLSRDSLVVVVVTFDVQDVGDAVYCSCLAAKKYCVCKGIVVMQFAICGIFKIDCFHQMNKVERGSTIPLL